MQHKELTQIEDFEWNVEAASSGHFPQARSFWRTHVISEQPERLWSLTTIFSAAAFFAAFFEFPTAVKTSDGE